MKRESFNDGWKFGKQGEEKRKVFLPHDAMQLEQRSADAKGGERLCLFPRSCLRVRKDAGGTCRLGREACASAVRGCLSEEQSLCE